MKFSYYILHGFCYLVSLLPLWVLYRISDLLYLILYYLIGYRKKIVRKNLSQAFPEKDEKERTKIEKEFYAFLCDYMVETLKQLSISDKNLKKRMKFEGVAEMVHALDENNKKFGFIYLGHYCNWEWISSLSARIHEIEPNIIGGQIYHPLYNKAFDRLMLKIRSRANGANIPMKETLRYIVKWKKAGQKAIIGFISDQGPKWNSIHHWSEFFHQKTPVFTGTEKIGKQVDALIFYADVKRIKRGYYVCKLSRMVDDVKKYPDFEVTDIYIQLLEQTINQQPAYWLWTHNRWKRTYEEYLKKINEGTLNN
ncbi:lysophospholipid acyltransferase family protein [uncultured Bacteroides sp.]|uniref:lysophospholipid acyltransferase family protein n=1 Tax=uncultured Bacteroides sp. TaxID=162156 RepID=UPI00260C0465|nr:lysophospholipid acyltransferase family protein [uncultured Bacteroides sp.]